MPHRLRCANTSDAVFNRRTRHNQNGCERIVHAGGTLGNSGAAHALRLDGECYAAGGAAPDSRRAGFPTPAHSVPVFTAKLDSTILTMKRRGQFGFFALLLCIAASNGWGDITTPRAYGLGICARRAGHDSVASGVVRRASQTPIRSPSRPLPAVITPWIDTTGPVLQTPGDFRVPAALSDPGTTRSFPTMVGTLNAGSLFWTGLKRLDVGLFNNGDCNSATGTGSSANPTPESYSLPPGASGSDQPRGGADGELGIVVFVMARQVGSFADPGLFASGQMYFVLNVAPGNTLNVLALAAATAAGSNVSLSTSDLQAARRTGSGLRDLAASSGLLIGAAADAPLFHEIRTMCRNWEASTT